MRWRRNLFSHPRRTKSIIGLLLFVSGVLLLMVAAPTWLWLTLLGIAAAWWGWQLFTEV